MRERMFLGAVGQEAEMADTHEAIGQNMEKKAADKFFGIEGHRFQAVFVSSVPVTKSDLAVFEGEDTVIGQSYAVGVAAEVVKHGLGRPERLFRIDDPALLA